MTNYISKVTLPNGTQVPFGGKIANGKWIQKRLSLSLSSGYANGDDIPFDLSSYLPDANSDFEIMVSCIGYTGTASGNSTGVQVTSDYYTGFPSTRLWRTNTRTANLNSRDCGSARIIIPASSQRLIIQIRDTSGTTGSLSGNISGYRRIGTNND